jgi:nucleosome assembly protein 1-like 1
LPRKEENADEGEDDDLEERLESDYNIGEDIKEKLIPRAIDWFTGAALEYEEIDEDDLAVDYEDDSEDVDEDDEDEDEDDEDYADDEGDNVPKVQPAGIISITKVC